MLHVIEAKAAIASVVRGLDVVGVVGESERLDGACKQTMSVGSRGSREDLSRSMAGVGLDRVRLTEDGGGRGADLGAERAAAQPVHTRGGGGPHGHAAHVVDAWDDQPVSVARRAPRHGAEGRLALGVARQREGVRAVVHCPAAKGWG